ERLGIAHYVLDYESRFRDAVIERFAESYLAGETPIPCVECNRSVKFADLLETARDLGADVLATGHYVASRPLANGRRGLFRAADVLASGNCVGGRPLANVRRGLCRAADPERDQSYFLYATTGEQLDFLRFPLGDMAKSETRALAHEFGLTVADKADSQDICFV